MYLDSDHFHSVSHLRPLLGVQSSRGNPLKVRLCHEVTEAYSAIEPTHTHCTEGTEPQDRESVAGVLPLYIGYKTGLGHVVSSKI